MNKTLKTLVHLLGLTFCTMGTAGERTETLIRTYCVRCHGEEKTEANMDLRGPYDTGSLLKHRKKWLKVIDQLELEDMPPKKPFPTEAEYAHLMDYLSGSIERVDWTKYHDPGRVSLARLTRVEYRHAIREIFEVDLQAGDYLGRDPEGQTGFSNDREALTFPLFALDDFMREAERAVEAWLNYHLEPWEQEIDLVDYWRGSSDKSVGLNAEETGVLLKERNAPFQLNLDLPFAGMYRIGLEAWPVQGEPVSAMHFMINGKSVERMVIHGPETNTYSVVLNLDAGANVVSLGFDPERAPIIQKRVEPRIVPEPMARKVLKPEVKKVPLPERLKNNQPAVKAWRKLNKTIRAFTWTQRLAESLTERDLVDYEQHDLVKNESRQIGLFSPSKVPFNLAAGSVAVFAGIPQKKLEEQIKRDIGFSHAAYAKAVRNYKAAWKKKYPERVRKTPGRIVLRRAMVNSHALGEQDTSPVEAIREGLATSTQAVQLIKRLGKRAYGRNLREDELAPLLRLYAEGEESFHGIRDALVGLLISPPFLLHYSETSHEQNRPVDDVELARRLARFLWLSIPDRSLRERAEGKKLKDRSGLKRTVDRMIEDPRFDAMARSVVEQWLDLESLSQLEQSQKVRPHIVMAMREEPVLLFRHVFREDRSLMDLVDPDYTFLNESLALHYGIDGVMGQDMRRIKLASRKRGGFLGMGGILTATSTLERTSPVTRGAFIVELLLGEELPPPPPSVPELQTANKARTIRDELELHRKDPACAGCHNRIDPFGFVLEHYDQFGAWREFERNQPVDARTVLTDGTPVHGLVEFKRYLVEQRHEDVLRNITERLFAFALGREVRYTDEATLRNILSALKEDRYRARTLVYEIVQSDAFRKQHDDDRNVEER
ncbi:MAG: DUF1592 domain-containing protein [Verrucomicrobiota bacterium]